MRVRGAGCAAVLLMLVAGCGNGGAGGDGGSGQRGEGGSKQSSASGVDGTADPAKVFTGAELGAALLPAEAVGKGTKALEVYLGLFDQGSGGGDWSTCVAGRDAHGELWRMRGASAERTFRPDPAAVGEDDPFVYERLVSMPAGRAGRYLELRRELHEACGRVTVDTDGALAEEHHEVRPLPDLGDEAVLETTRTTGGDEYDGSAHYVVELRVGGVLVIVGAGTDMDLTLSSAAEAARRVGKDLYGAS
ncbi:hypothetical protein ACFCWG_27070 [Streptomyces sp. NPDC056390]|uniref:hypothetical protein n=1 Tax=Streptomyces sp. NPDC056390 TaxID=3345806 RepID=UPI0035D925B3